MRKRKQEHSHSVAETLSSVVTGTTSYSKSDSMARSEATRMSGRTVQSTVMRAADGKRKELEMKARYERERTRLHETALKLAQAERALVDLSSSLKNQTIRQDIEEKEKRADLKLLEERADTLRESEIVFDGIIKKQEEELEALETTADQMRLKFIYAFLTNKYDLGFYCDPREVFGRLRRVSTLLNTRRSSSVDKISYKPSPGNIVTPYLTATREELYEIEEGIIASVELLDTTKEDGKLKRVETRRERKAQKLISKNSTVTSKSPSSVSLQSSKLDSPQIANKEPATPATISSMAEDAESDGEATDSDDYFD